MYNQKVKTENNVKQVFTPVSFYGKLFRDDVKGGFKW